MYTLEDVEQMNWHLLRAICTTQYVSSFRHAVSFTPHEQPLHKYVVVIFFYRQGNSGFEGSSPSHIASNCQRGDVYMGLSTYMRIASYS